MVLILDYFWLQTDLFSGLRSKTQLILSRFQMLQTSGNFTDLFRQPRNIWDTTWDPGVAVASIDDEALFSRINQDIPGTVLQLIQGDVLYGEILEKNEKALNFNRQLEHFGLGRRLCRHESLSGKFYKVPSHVTRRKRKTHASRS